MKDRIVVRNPWEALRRHTPARIALGRAGAALPTEEVLAFSLAHARARDAVHFPLDARKLAADLRQAGYESRLVRSRAPDRPAYLTRPDLGRRLEECSSLRPGGERVVVIADGLSALAVQSHAVPLLSALAAIAPGRWGKVPVVVALQGRVAIGDEIGEQMGARLAVVLIGERPGLSSPDSLGIYVTHSPRVGRSDAERNCISNVRPAGLGYEAAARKLDWLAAAALARGMTGVALKDESAQDLLR